MNELLVSEIRTKNIKITRHSIVYFWWFKCSCLSELFKNFNNSTCAVDCKKLKVRTFQKIDYALLYIGKAKNGNNRLIKYHILDSSNYHLSGVQNGRLSSLRTTLCGLLNLPMSLSRSYINDFIDKNCIVDWVEVDTNMLEIEEQRLIKENILPLNYQHCKASFSKEYRRMLTKFKKDQRK